MLVRCHLYAVEADQIEPMKINPALVLGRGILAGMPSCHLESSTDALQELLRDGGRDGSEPAGFLDEGGYRLAGAGVMASTKPRLFSPEDVRSFDQRLRSLNETELFRRFNQLAVAACGVDALHLLEACWEDCAEGDEADESWSGDWTIDQAEEYEVLAQDFERLRAFIAQATQQGQGVVIAEA